MKTKEEVIKDAWGMAWQFAKNDVNENGFVYGGFQYDYPFFNYDDFEGYELIRPKSLQGIEDNNGWIKVESEEDLPNSFIGRTFVYTDEKNIYNYSQYIQWDSIIYGELITHYFQIKDIKPPLY